MYTQTIISNDSGQGEAGIADNIAVGDVVIYSVQQQGHHVQLCG